MSLDKKRLRMTTHLLVVSISLPLSRLVGVLASWIEKNKLGFGLWIQELTLTSAWVLERGCIQTSRDGATRSKNLVQSLVV